MSNESVKNRIGVVGGGQLGLMLAEAAKKYRVACNFLDSSDDAPCKPIANYFIKGSLYDSASIKQLASESDVITYETEHVNAQALKELQEAGKKIIPSPQVLEIMQDKVKQKEFLRINKLPTAPFAIAKNWEDVLGKIEHIKSNKVVVKADTGGYDGKGVLIANKKEILAKRDNPVGGKQILLEECIDFEKELAVMIAKDQQGSVVVYPIVEMYFDEKANLLDYLFCPANISKEVELKINEISQTLGKCIDSAGLFAVELFLDKYSTVFINEIASRPHNSQHHTIEACNTSQYEQLVRILLGLPLGATDIIKPSAILNIVGPEGISGAYKLNGVAEAEKLGEVYIHMYNKSISKPSRKLGHITVMGKDMDDVKQKINKVKSVFKVVSA